MYIGMGMFLFRFQTGSIKRICWTLIYGTFLGFDSKLVRLKDNFPREHEDLDSIVSIPNWFD